MRVLSVVPMPWKEPSRRPGRVVGRIRRSTMVLAAVMSGVGVSALGGLALAQPASAADPVLYVATTGSDAGANNCQTIGTPCATLGHALAEAATGDTIVIEPGTYLVTADPSGTSNTVPAALSGLTIESQSGTASNTIINAAGAINGLLVNASDVTVSALTFENAGGAGLQVSPPSTATAPAAVTGETIQDNISNNSDQCSLTPSTAACTAAIGPGDYGESMWLMSVTDSTINGNLIENGLDGGLLVSDELGPNDGNIIENNSVLNNILGCGITLAAHNMGAAGPSGPNPTVAGVYNNTVENNTSNGSGANGIGLFNAAYNNTIRGNSLSGNGGPGIEIDDDVPFADLNGNTITGNTVGVNSLLGGPGGDSPGQHTVHTTQTGGVLVIARVTPVTGTVISGNTITGNYYGIWMSAMAATTTLTNNTITVAKGGKAVFISPAPGTGYWQVGTDGGVFAFGAAPYEGSTGGIKLAQPVVGITPTPDGGGYWMAAKDGGIFSFGDANYYGSIPALKAKVSNIVGIASTPDGGGYWLVGSDGGVFGFGDAKYYGSIPALKAKVSNIVGIASTPDGGGYWMVGSDGGVFGFGDAKYYGSVPALKAKVSNVVGIASTPDGAGYWMVGSDGGTFGFGDAKYYGSIPALKVKVSNIVSLASSADGKGYWLLGSDGGMFSFGDAKYYGSLPGLKVKVSNIVGMMPTP